MDNQAAPAQLLFPQVPENFCPQGSWSDIFNLLINLYLNAGTVNIPGLGLVTPQEINTINQNIKTLSNTLASLAINVQSGNYASVGSGGAQSAAITFTTAMPNANYIINGYFGTDGATVPAVNYSWAVVVGSQTTTGFTLNIYNTSSHVTNFYWTVTEITSTVAS